MSNQPQVSELVEHLFRHQAGQMLATLTHVFGVENLDLAEDVVQESLIIALQQWPYQGIPDNPRAWLISVARNKALDLIRRKKALQRKEPELKRRLIEHRPESDLVDKLDAAELADEQLAMIFVCCEPSLSIESQVALTLKAVSGFSIAEIARAFLCEDSTIAQRIVRAKKRIREEGITLKRADEIEIPQRLDSVLHVLYLMFNEGYAAHEGLHLIREDLCAEAIRLTQLLAIRSDTGIPKVHALLALFYFQAARFETRQDVDGNLLLLDEQDRSKWDQELLTHGIAELELAAQGSELSTYHLQAGIAALHATSQSYAATDWQRLLELYDQLLSLAPSPVVTLNRAIAESMIDGPQVALNSLNELAETPTLRNYHLLPAVRADFLRRLGVITEAVNYYQQALSLSRSDPERRFLSRRIEELNADR